MHAIQTAPVDEARARLVDFLAGVGDEVVETDARRTPPGAAVAGRRAVRLLPRGQLGLRPPRRPGERDRASRFQALRAFKRRFGLAPHAYQLRVRLGLAQKSLREGMPPAHVAAELGFVDQSHFTRHFKQLVGVTPAKYARGIIPTPTVPVSWPLPRTTSRAIKAG